MLVPVIILMYCIFSSEKTVLYYEIKHIPMKIMKSEKQKLKIESNLFVLCRT